MNRLLPDDDIVVVVRDLSGGVVSNRYLSVKDVIEDAAFVSDFVAVVQADRIDTALSKGNSWVEARLHGTVREVIRLSKSHHLSVGQSITVNVAPGEQMIGGVLVLGTDDPEDDTRYLRLLPTNRSYLLFMVSDVDVEVPFLAHEPLLIQSNTLTYPWPPRTSWFEPSRLMQGLTLTEVTRIAKHATTSWRLTQTPTKRKQ
jgi:hypothetical protein